MEFKKSVLAVAVAMGSTSVMAGGLMASKDINVTGDFAAGGIYVVNHGGAGEEAIQVFDFGIGFDTGETKTGDVGFIGVIGNRSCHTIIDQNPYGANCLGEGMAFDFGYATYKASDMVTIDAGILLTTIGAESAPSVLNANISHGFLWNFEPGAYPGIRASFGLGGTTVSAEINQDSSQGQGAGATSWQLNVGGEAGAVSYAATYYDGKESNNIFDVLVSTKIGKMDFTFNMDYFMLDNAASGQDDSAMGIALFLTPNMGKFDVPVRVEYVSDGTSGVYGGVDSATSFTVTPTLHTSDNSFVRLEVSFVNSDKDVFLDSDGKATNTQTKAALQIGTTF